jgi:intracellular sulfur oxidation DsrE/DsrF family protein
LRVAEGEAIRGAKPAAGRQNLLYSSDYDAAADARLAYLQGRIRMTDIKEPTTILTPRRGFFTRIAGMMALGAAAFVPTASQAEGEADDGPDWPGKLTGRHKQVIDAYAINEGFPLGFTLNFLTPNKSATGVVIFRHEAFPLALNHAMWAKYKIGEGEKIEDPETKAHAVKNPYFEPKAGVLRNDNTAIDKLLARGVVMGACALALRAHARRMSKNAGVTPEEAATEFTANIIPGITVIPSGVWGINRAQEAGCTYCAGG